MLVEIVACERHNPASRKTLIIFSTRTMAHASSSLLFTLLLIDEVGTAATANFRRMVKICFFSNDRDACDVVRLWVTLRELCHAFDIVLHHPPRSWPRSSRIVCSRRLMPN